MSLASDLKKLAPTASQKIIDGIVSNKHFLDDAKITTPLRMRHFFSRVCVETGGLRSLEENLKYSAARLVHVWPKRFPTLAAAQPYANNPKKLANKVYGGRMGNSAKNDDGWNFRGSGLLQDTGKTNFQIVEDETGLPVVENPGMLRVFPSALEAATIYWTKHNLNKLADKNDGLGICKAINGGTNGWAEQKVYLAKAEKIWPDGAAVGLISEPAPAKPAPVEDPIPVVPDPPTKETIEAAQARLKELGYNPGGADGKIGPLTKGAILSFKNDNGLTPNDTIDEAFLTALATASPRKMADDRAKATVGEVAAKVPEAKMHWWTRLGAYVGMGSTAVAGTTDYIAPSVSYLQTVKDFAGDVPTWVWFASVIGLCVVLAIAAQYGLNKSKEAFNSGERR